MEITSGRAAGRRKKCRPAFTLIELIVVITIIGILGTFVVMRAARWPVEVRKTKVRNDLKTIIQAADLYKIANGSYPSSIDELRSPRETGSAAEPYLKEAIDPWMRPYLYEVLPDGKPRAWCLGRDGVEGGEGEDADAEETT